MANFVSWSVEYARAKNALATRSWNEYFMQSVENHEEMRTTYTILGNVSKFVDWLAAKASEEAYGDGIEGGLPMAIGGN